MQVPSGCLRAKISQGQQEDHKSFNLSSKSKGKKPQKAPFSYDNNAFKDKTFIDLILLLNVKQNGLTQNTSLCMIIQKV